LEIWTLLHCFSSAREKENLRLWAIVRRASEKTNWHGRKVKEKKRKENRKWKMKN